MGVDELFQINRYDKLIMNEGFPDGQTDHFIRQVLLSYPSTQNDKIDYVIVLYIIKITFNFKP